MGSREEGGELRALRDSPGHRGQGTGLGADGRCKGVGIGLASGGHDVVSGGLLEAGKSYRKHRCMG